MKLAFALILSLFCEKILEVWHKAGKQEEYVKRGEIVYTLKPQHAKYVPDANSIQLSPSEKDLYNVKVNSLGEAPKAVTFSSAKWCMLEASQFSDKFTVHFDKEGNFFHADYHPGAHGCQEEAQVTNVEFNTSIDLVKPHHELRYMRPDMFVSAWLRVTEEELKQKENAEYSNFFTKYWYIIVPVVLVLLVGGGDPPKEGEGNGGR
ncbi:hypothetical protein K493DRAFT_305453 [Basidiobolus meristosporus CBS 931.73]|uniref:ER membrane protein complex subunit 10 n=1 Tax=Basidiobolus meristosporus CBS 931.73 TaxID=1314790 RepID=A0A1Y1XVL0_9FUNG|nr:hypothetical protein K493DRAFT_305453 [Basidiobolus meristosporus CBS 931.73]|eukprot:ORX89802.1 hypothetical protein K493DRAFT_305453 [Basidiobolus meristosporus CBS 931.73]